MKQEVDEGKTKINMTKEEHDKIETAADEDILRDSNENIEQKIEYARNEKNFWREKTLNETDPKRKIIFENMEKNYEGILDALLVQENRMPESEEGKQNLERTAEESEFAKLERLKKWVKRNANLLGIGTGVVGVLFAIGGFIAQTLYTVRNSGQKTALEVSKLSREMNKTFPGAGALLSLFSKSLFYVSKNIANSIL